MDQESAFIIAVVAISSVAVVSLAGIIGGLLYARRVRLLVHAERIKALEMGRELPDEVGSGGPGHVKGRSPADKCYAIAGQACFWGFVFAAGSGTTGGPHGLGISIAIAAATGAIGVTSVICGSALSAKMMAAPRRRDYSSASVKEYYEPEEV